ncbi:MAG: cache domain-containing protein [Hydrogenophaga sp.]|uniref:cache domain-containing protein n=1 Tax=Hydrogenophaga sp. TaxID=1904254 RepID=UPI0027356844|nr:cache domain-containing protein [Hydrogenophaga sp.]MDP3349394.1 cache domain-containing protein [Hydrogenophaga sp.]
MFKLVQRRFSLGAWLALAFTLLSLLLTVMLTVFSDRTASTQVRRSIGNNLAELANQTTSRLDQAMFERYREVRLIANRLSGPLDLVEVKREIEALQQSYPTYAWIGVTDPSGKVLVATRNMLEGADVSQRPWFQNALKGQAVGDVHEALLLAQLMDSPGGEPMRFVDIAFPLKDNDGQITGVLGVHLSWKWARDIEQAIFVPVGRSRTIDPLIVSSTGAVLLGPPEVEGLTLQLRSVDEALQGKQGFVRETWADGEDYLVGYSSDRGFEDYPGLGWRVLVRQDLDEAYAPVDQLHQRMLLGGGVAALLFSLLGWGLARWITRPLLGLADVARGLEAGYTVKVPASSAYEEVAILGGAFNSMVKTLQHNEEELRQLNVSLERRVLERTAELQSSFERMDDSDARTRAVIDTAQEPFVGMDFEGCITDWNPQAEKLFGWSREEALGESLAHLVVPVRYQVAFIEALAQFHQTGNAPFVGQRMRRILVDRHGNELPVELKIGLINTERLKLFSAFIRDLREQS